MSFSDDELKRFKTEYDELPVEKIEALLTRLEAAERVIEVVMSHGKSDLCILCLPDIEAWRKVAGKVDS